MFPDEPNTVGLTALEIHGHLAQLQAERAPALGTGVAAINPHMADLDEEIEATCQLVVSPAVTEIATPRAVLFGAQHV